MIEHEVVKGSLREIWTELGLNAEEIAEDRCNFVYEKIGLSLDDPVTMYTGTRDEQEEEYRHGIEIGPGLRKLTSGWELFEDIGDYSVAIYKDGKAVAGFYESNRGSLYQSGAYFAEDSSYWATNNMQLEEKWVKAKDFCSEIAHDWLLGEQG